MSPSFRSFLLILVGGCILFMLAYLRVPLTVVDNQFQYIFWGNDSFFHAARIVETAEDPGRFYEYDERSDTQIVWPWGYDWILGTGLYLLKKVLPQLNFESALIHLPPLVGFLNIFLLFGLLRRLDLGVYSTAAVIVVFALSPLTQGLHYVGRIDHHMFELSFALATLWAGLSWFQDTKNANKAILLGVVLGSAHFVHTSLFILQLPVLLTLFICWCLGVKIITSGRFVAALLLSLSLTLIPSSYFQSLIFDYKFLSWFHLYIALCVSVFALLFTRITFCRRNLMVVGIIALLLTLPVISNFLHGVQFITGTLSGIKDIAEVGSPIGLEYSFYYYGYFLCAFPLSFYALYRYWKEDKGNIAGIYISLAFTLGISMLLSQFRFHYFGFFALIIPYALLAEQQIRITQSRKTIYSSLTIIFVLFSLPAAPTITEKDLLAGVRSYFYLHAQTMVLRKACEENPGVVFASPDVGHILRYFTKCKVTSNMMLITERDFEKKQQFFQLERLNLQEFLNRQPQFDYIYLFRTHSFSSQIPLEVKKQRLQGLQADLMLEEYSGQQLELLHSQRITNDNNLGNFDEYPVAVLYRINKTKISIN